MRLQVEHAPLMSAVNYSNLAVKRSGVPVMECVQIDACDSSLSIVGTSIDVQAQAKCEASVSVAGSATVNASDLRLVTSKMSGVVSMTMTEAGLLVEAGQTSITLPVRVDKLPLTKCADGKEVHGALDALAACAPFCLKSDEDYRRKGVLLDDGRAVAADMGKFYLTSITDGPGKIIPVEALPLISKTGGRFFCGDTTWRVESDGRKLHGKVIDGDYLNWRAVIFDGDLIMQVDADEFTKAVESVTLGRAKELFASSSNGQVSLSGGRFNGSHIEGLSKVRADGIDCAFVCCPKNMVEAMVAMAGSVVEIHTNGSLLKICRVGGDDFAIVATMRDSRTKLPAPRVAA